MMNPKFWILFPAFGLLFMAGSQAQTPIQDRAVVAQQERMVFKQWDEDRFLPRPNRFLGIPTNSNWYLTWALHPNYPKLDRRPLSARGEQTQRMALAVAMKISSDYYKQQTDTIRNLATREMARISGAFSSADPLYLLYYKKELAPLENSEAQAFQHQSAQVKAYLEENGAYAWYLENMKSLAERYGFAKTEDMERGQRILMYHRILLDLRKLKSDWDQKLALSRKVLALKETILKRQNGSGQLVKKADPTDEILSGILQRRISLR
ncbi:hypothetical protein SAMN04488057_11270 [Cyclobacterium lianum]|uniref:DUF5045 domain-containing protein n=1 Tax=Cyclobacterium lianum TaxID=388280 RepID=A0A1M7PZG2_9BACT|nr:hypothetical protein [Cyclobacterium lianum]SHN23179.1 hypothetical protein SAMN04488057_11270 [Cyclobacterium lianum]